MLLVAETKYGVYVAETKDNSLEAVSASFEMMGHPEFTLNNVDSLEINKDYDIYDWDDIATYAGENGISIDEVNYVNDITPVGTISVYGENYVVIKGDIVR